MTRFALLLAVLSLVPPLAPASAQDKFFDSKGVRIRYIDQGTGEPIVLVHGFTGSIETNWLDTGIVANLAKDYRVIALDCRGHGKSDKPHDPSAYGAEMGRDIVRLLDHLDIPDAHIVGYSMGSRIIGKLLTTDPGRFRSATLGGSPPHRSWTAEDERQQQERARQYEKGDIGELLRSNSQKPISDEQIRAAEAFFGKQDLEALAAVQRSVGQNAVTDAQLSKVTVPILGIVGTADRRLEGVRELKKVIPNIKVVELEGADHLGACRRPEFVKETREFIASHRGN